MPGDERIRASAAGPRRYRVLDRRPAGPGEVRLVLAPVTAAGTGEEAGDRSTATRSGPTVGTRPGQYWILHTDRGMRVPAVDVAAPASVPAAKPSGGSAAGGDAASVLEVSTWRLPCGPPLIDVGDQLKVRGPLGSGWDSPGVAGRNLLLIAWESGLIPLRPLIEHAIAANRAPDGAGAPRYGRIRIWAGGRTWRSIPFQREWNRWAGWAGVTVSASPLLTMRTAVREVDFAPATTEAMLSGPLPMARATADALIGRGLRADRIQLAAHQLIRCGDRSCGRCRIPASGGGRADGLRACADGPVIRYPLLAGAWSQAGSAAEGDDRDQ